MPFLVWLTLHAFALPLWRRVALMARWLLARQLDRLIDPATGAVRDPGRLARAGVFASLCFAQDACMLAIRLLAHEIAGRRADTTFHYARVLDCDAPSAPALVARIADLIRRLNRIETLAVRMARRLGRAIDLAVRHVPAAPAIRLHAVAWLTMPAVMRPCLPRRLAAIRAPP